LESSRAISYTVLMLIRSRRPASQSPKSPHPAEQQGSYSQFRNRRRSRNKKLIIAAVLIVLVGVPSFLVLKSLRAAANVLQAHSGATTDALKQPAQAPDAKVEAEGRVNIVLLGVGDAAHAGSTLSDTMIVASVDPETKEVAMLSLPRDLYVPIPGRGYDKINAAHAYGELKKQGEGPNLAKEVVGNVLDVPIHYFVRADFTGFRKAIDTLGGVKVDVPVGLSDSEYPCDNDERRACGFSIKAGMQQMNGALALKYARCRKGTCGNDFGRASRQQQVLMAMREKALTLSTLSNPAKLASLIDTVGSHVRTDLGTEELGRLSEILREVKPEAVVSRVVDGEQEKLVRSTMIDGASVVVPELGPKNYEAIRAFAHTLFFDRHIVSENIPITVIDASGKAGQAQKVADLLKTYRYNVIEVKSAAQIASSSTLVATKVDLGSYTRRYLEHRFGLTASEVQDGQSPQLTLTIGSDYTGLNGKNQ